MIKTIGNHLFVILDKNDQSIHTRHKDQIIFDNNAVSLSYPPIRSDVPNGEEGEKPGNTNGADNNVTYAPAPVNQETQQPLIEIESQPPESQEMISFPSIRPHNGNSLPSQTNEDALLNNNSVRRSTRNKRFPNNLKDFQCSGELRQMLAFDTVKSEVPNHHQRVETNQKDEVERV